MLTNIKFFFRNLWAFRKFLWKYRQWDYQSGFLEYNAVALKDVRDCLVINDRFVNSQKTAKKITICLNLVNRLRDSVHLDMYDTYHDMVTEKLDNGMYQIVDFGIRRKQGVPKSASSLKHEHRDMDYLFDALKKHSASFWD